jgi:predicted transcriptional regulator
MTKQEQKQDIAIFILNIIVEKSKVQTKILKLLCDGEKSISEINNSFLKEDGTPEYNYRTVWQHIQSLKKYKLITEIKKEHEAGKPSIISLASELKGHESELKEWFFKINKEKPQ